MLRFAVVSLLLGAALAQSPTPRYDVHAVRFASVPYQVRNLVAGAEAGRSINIAFTVWAVRGEGRVVLVDAGFYRDKFKERWKPQEFAKPNDALRTGLGITPESVIADITAGDLGAWVAEENGHIVAFAMADRRDASIFALFTKPDCESRGYGSRLLGEAEAWLAAQGHREFWLSTARGSTAEKFYAHREWRPSGENAAAPDDIVFRKKISPI